MTQGMFVFSRIYQLAQKTRKLALSSQAFDLRMTGDWMQAGNKNV